MAELISSITGFAGVGLGALLTYLLDKRKRHPVESLWLEARKAVDKDPEGLAIQITLERYSIVETKDDYVKAPSAHSRKRGYYVLIRGTGFKYGTANKTQHRAQIYFQSFNNVKEIQVIRINDLPKSKHPFCIKCEKDTMKDDEFICDQCKKQEKI